MSDPNPESSERSRIKGAHEVTLAYIREGSEVARGHNKHADQMLVWLIALSGGSVLLAFQVPDRFLPTSTWWLIVAIVPWAVTVVAGVWARDLMARLMLADDMSTHTWAWELAHLPFLKDYASVEFKTRLLQIVERKNESGETPQSERDLANLSQRAFFWYRICSLLFAVGVLWFGLIVALGLLGA